MNWARLNGCLLFAMCVACAPLADAPRDAATQTPAYIQPFPVVAFPASASENQRSAARAVAKILGTTVVVEAAVNPVCCVWVEVTNWHPNAGTRGYVIINQEGGSIISATDDDQLGEAIDWLSRACRQTGSGVQVPVGLCTNFKVVAGW